MAKVKVVGSSYTITSKLRKEDILLLQEWVPESLQIRDDAGSLLFSVTTGKTASVSSHGICFNGISNDGSGFASLTKMLPDDLAGEELNEYVHNEAGKAIASLIELEETAESRLSAVREKKAKVASCIELL